MDPPVQRVNHIDICRMLMSNLYLSLGCAVTDDSKQRAVSFLADNQRLRRAVKLLDDTPARECHKIGVIYVAEGQDDQRQILRNYGVDSDKRYQHFLRGLGWRVDMRQHRGFVGGLDRSGVDNGTHSIYYAGPSEEIMFHVVTMMPTRDSDAQQLHKKRHVGNDHVQVVYCNDHKMYRPATITSQFNDAHIVVYPLPNGLYRIAVHRKETMPPFGPLHDGMIVTPQTLGPLVRTSVLNASRARRRLNAKYVGPARTRRQNIKDIVARHSDPITKSDAAQFLAHFFASSRRKTAAAHGAR